MFLTRVLKSSRKALAGVGRRTWSIPITAQPMGAGQSTTIENTIGDCFQKKQEGLCRYILGPVLKRGENKNKFELDLEKEMPRTFFAKKA